MKHKLKINKNYDEWLSDFVQFTCRNCNMIEINVWKPTIKAMLMDNYILKDRIEPCSGYREESWTWYPKGVLNET